VVIATLKGHEGAVHAVAFSPKEFGPAVSDAKMRVWNQDARGTTVLGGVGREAGSLALSADGKTVAVGQADGTIVLGDLTGGKSRRRPGVDVVVLSRRQGSGIRRGRRDDPPARPRRRPGAPLRQTARVPLEMIPVELVAMTAKA